MQILHQVQWAGIGPTAVTDAQASQGGGDLQTRGQEGKQS